MKPHETHATTTRVLDSAGQERFRAFTRGRTQRDAMEVLGVGYTLLWKLQGGGPVSVATADRIEGKLRQLLG